jgi:hypothetical protein
MYISDWLIKDDCTVRELKQMKGFVGLSVIKYTALVSNSLG